MFTVHFKCSYRFCNSNRDPEIGYSVCSIFVRIDETKKSSVNIKYNRYQQCTQYGAERPSRQISYSIGNHHKPSLHVV